MQLITDRGYYTWTPTISGQSIPVHFEDEEQSQVSSEQPQVSSSHLSSTSSGEDQSEISEQTRPQRTKSRPAWMREYEVTGIDQFDDPITHFALLSDCDPVIFKNAVQDPKWQQAMDEEIHAIEKNNTWELTNIPKGHKSIDVKWVYKTKLNAQSKIEKYKARLIAKGYKQHLGIDYNEVFAPVARHDTIRLVIALAAPNSWPIFQLDVKSTFLYEDLQEEVYVDQPPGYVCQGNETKVYKLRKALYGLKQAPRACAMFDAFKSSMMKEFAMTDLGMLHYFLGIETFWPSFSCNNATQLVQQCNSVGTPIDLGLKLTKDPEGKKIDNILYKQMVGSLMYLTITRPDIMHGVSLISRYMEHPTELYLLAAKRIFRYLKGTTDFGILYKKGEQSGLIGFTDSDYASDSNDRKSTSGYIFTMGSGVISWLSRKQPIVTLSTTEAEFVAVASCACQAIWLRRLLETLQHPHNGSTPIYCGNSSTIKLSKNPVLHGRSKHIDVRYHFLRDLVKDETLDLKHCRSADQLGLNHKMARTEPRKRKRREEKYDTEDIEQFMVEEIDGVMGKEEIENAPDEEKETENVDELAGIPIQPYDHEAQTGAIFILENASLEVVKLGKEVITKNSADYRPDIAHQHEQGCFSSGELVGFSLKIVQRPLNKAGRLRALYVKTENGVLFEIKPYVRIPRTYKRFSGIMSLLLQKLSITAVGESEKLLRVIKNPVTQYLPLNSRKIGFSYISEKLVDIRDYVAAVSDDVNFVFVVGAMAHGKIDIKDYADDFIST
ncbi:unnamed protein product [Camellia sinensis]